MSRIDKIDLSLYVYDEFEGHRNISFSVVPATDDEPLVMAVRAAWEKWSATQLAQDDTGKGDLLL